MGKRVAIREESFTAEDAAREDREFWEKQMAAEDAEAGEPYGW
jgi:hypothetical protein